MLPCHEFEAFALELRVDKKSPTAQFEAAVDSVVSGDESRLDRLLRARPALIHARSKRPHHSTLLLYVGANGVEGFRQKTPKNAVRIAERLLAAGPDVDAVGEMYRGTTTLGLVALPARRAESRGMALPAVSVPLELQVPASFRSIAARRAVFVRRGRAHQQPGPEGGTSSWGFGPWRRPQIRGLLIALLTLAPAGAPLLAQSAPEAEMTEAARLRETRQFADAIAALRRHLARQPDDATAARMLAETLYWHGDVDAARAAYAEAERRHPGDVQLRLDHARMLVELNDQAGASKRLQELRAADPTAGEAEALLGTLAQYRGDLTAARRHFREALRLRPGHTAAEQALADIRQTTAPSVHTRFRFYDDDQPLTRASLVTSAGAYFTPLHALLVETEVDRFTTGGARSGATVLGVLRGYWPGARLQTEVAAGVRQGAPVLESEWLGRAKGGLRLTHGVTASFAAQREPYLRTFASTLQPVLIDTVAGQLDWETKSGWIAQSLVRRVVYPDANSGASVAVWALAPLVQRDTLQIRGGYAFEWHDTRESRFAPVLPDVSSEGPLPPQVPPRPGPGRAPAVGDSIQGVYSPYFTPLDVQTHSVTGALSAQASPRVSVRINGSYGVHARETAPFFYYDVGDTRGSLAVRSGLYSRRYTPLLVRAAIDTQVHRQLSLQIEVEHMRGSFWRGTQVAVGLLHRFQSASATR